MTTPEAFIGTTEPVLAPRRSARLGSYTLWQVRDYALNRGAPTLIVALLFGYLGLSAMLAMVNSPAGPPVNLI